MVILVTASLDEESLAQLRLIGDVRYQPLAESGALLAGRRLVEMVEGVDVLVTEADPVTEADMAAFSTLKVICSCRGNPVNVDVAAASRLGLLVINAPARNAIAVAELTIALMIMLGRRIPAAASTLRSQRDGTADERMRGYFELRGHELWGKVVGLIGIGAVGGEVAERLRGFGVQLVAFDPFAPTEGFARVGAHSLSLDDVMATSDFVSVHAAVTETSRRMIGVRQFSLMQPSAFFINTARSAITDQDALVAALQARRIAGAALDVFDQEPLPLDHPLLALDNVILLPHIGGNTVEIAVHQGRIIVPDLLRLARGERPVNLVNAEAWNSFDVASLRRRAGAIRKGGAA